jgi:hypothetical protein
MALIAVNNSLGIQLLPSILILFIYTTARQEIYDTFR